MPVFLLEAFGAKTRAAVPALTFSKGATNGDITLVINPEEMTQSFGLGRWRKRGTRRDRFNLMSTNFKYPEQKIDLNLRLDEEDLDIWKERSEGGIIAGERQGIIFRFNYRRSRPAFADISVAIGYFVIESLNATLAQESGRLASGGGGGRLEWQTRISMLRVALNDSPITQ